MLAKKKKIYSSACFIFKIPFMQVEMMAGAIFRQNCADIYSTNLQILNWVALEFEV